MNVDSTFSFHRSSLINPGWLTKLRLLAFNAYSALFEMVISFSVFINLRSIFFLVLNTKAIALSVFSPANESQDFPHGSVTPGGLDLHGLLSFCAASKSKSNIHWLAVLSRLESFQTFPIHLT